MHDICPCKICPGNICPYQEYLSCYSPDFDHTLKVGSWDHLEQISTVMVTFVQATFVLATFVHIKNISAITVPTKIFEPNFLGALNFFGLKFCMTQTFYGPKNF